MAKPPVQPARPAYERRLILFIDFLGFREVVATTEDDADALDRLVSAMDAIGAIGGDGVHPSERVTQFSDSVVLSYRVDELSGAFWMINAMALTVVSLAARGYLLRGAVTVGDLYHTSAHIVGPAMVRAYEMESQIAVVPRVIIDPAVIAVARRYRNEDHTPDEEEEYVRAFMADDDDGQLYFDYVSWNSVVAITGGDDEYYPDYIAGLSRLLGAGLRHDDPRVVEKHLWLHRRYTAALDLVSSLPEDNPYRIENPENCGAIEGLPRYDRRAREGQRRVDEYRATIRQGDAATAR